MRPGRSQYLGRRSLSVARSFKVAEVHAAQLSIVPPYDYRLGGNAEDENPGRDGAQAGQELVRTACHVVAELRQAPSPRAPEWPQTRPLALHSMKIPSESVQCENAMPYKPLSARLVHLGPPQAL